MENSNNKIATFAGGCFWCMVTPFNMVDGVKSTVSGYTGGNKDNPTYKEVKAQTTGHLEAIKIEYDPNVVSYQDLLERFWEQIDPTDDGGQFHDRGESYRTAIFYQDDEQKEIAEKSKLELEGSGKFSKPIVTKILPLGEFYVAEEYHQDFYAKNPDEYKMDRKASGRDEFIEKHWK